MASIPRADPLHSPVLPGMESTVRFTSVVTLRQVQVLPRLRRYGRNSLTGRLTGRNLHFLPIIATHKTKRSGSWMRRDIHCSGSQETGMIILQDRTISVL